MAGTPIIDNPDGQWIIAKSWDGQSAIGNLSMDNRQWQHRLADRQTVVPLPDWRSAIATLRTCQSGLSIADVFAIADYQLSIVNSPCLWLNAVSAQRQR